MNDPLKKFFDKKINDEDLPVEVDDIIQVNYSNLNKIYEEFFEENSISLAKVIYHLIQANFQGRKRLKETRR